MKSLLITAVLFTSSFSQAWEILKTEDLRGLLLHVIKDGPVVCRMMVGHDKMALDCQREDSSPFDSTETRIEIPYAFFYRDQLERRTIHGRICYLGHGMGKAAISCLD